jgi:hypothetical protein
MDFKVRVLDFISIYVREMKKPENTEREWNSQHLIKGLLKSLQVAHSDKNTILFDRIKTVLTQLSKSSQSAQINTGDIADAKILMTEVVALVLKPTKDTKMHLAYVDCFISLSKQFSQSEDIKLQKFLTFTYKELLKKYLGGRGASAHCLNQQFFQRIFEECNPKLSLSLMKPLLRYLLPSSAGQDKALAESENGSDFTPEKGDKGNKSGARSNHQRLMAIEIFNTLVKSAHKNESLAMSLSENTSLITDVLVTVVKTSDSWQQKKVKKTMLALGIFTKLAKATKDAKNAAKSIGENGAKLIKAIEHETNRDTAMSNLKGKIKEIKVLIEAA